MRRFATIIALFFVLALSAGEIAAQESTAEAPVTVATESTEPVAAERVTLNIGQLVAALIGGFVTGGCTVGGALMIVFERVKHDPALTLAIEGLINSVPIQYKEGAHGVAKTAREVATVVEELTDDKPGITVPGVG